MHCEGPTRVTRPAQGAFGDDRGGIEELEERAEREQRLAERDDRGVVGEDPQQQLGDREERHRDRPGEDPAELER